MRILILASALAASACFPACGGAEGPSGLAPVTITLLSSATLDGFIFSTGLVRLDNEIYVGDTGPAGLRGFVSFDLAAIPAGATVTAATMRLYQFAVFGTPYASLVPLLVDHLDYGASLDFGDYALAAILSGFGTLSTDATIEFKSLAVTARVTADRAAARTRSQFRLRFSVENNGDMVQDSCGFQKAGNLPANQVPTLVVTYQP